MPPLYFSNTIDNFPIVSDKIVQIEVLRQGQPVRNDVSNVNEGNQFSGKENEMHLTTKNAFIFECYFDLSWFPFDY